MPDKTENTRKTLANCKNSDFLPAAMKARKIVCETYKKINVKSIVERFKESDTQNAGAMLEMIMNVIGTIFTEYPAETVQLAAIAGFMTEDEAENVPPTELFAILLECALSVRVLDFFISVENMGGKNTDGIYPALIFLRVISGAMNTSDSESQTNTTDTSANASAGDISEKP